MCLLKTARDDYLFIRICVLMCCWDVFTSQIYSEKDSLILYIYPTQKTRHNQSTQNTFYNDNFFLSPTRVNTSHCIANTATGRGHGRPSSIPSPSHRNFTQTASFITSVVAAAAAAVWQNIYSSHFTRTLKWSLQVLKYILTSRENLPSPPWSTPTREAGIDSAV